MVSRGTANHHNPLCVDLSPLRPCPQTTLSNPDADRQPCKLTSYPLVGAELVYTHQQEWYHFYMLSFSHIQPFMWCFHLYIF